MRRSVVSAHTHADLRNYTIRYTLCVGCFIKRRFLNHKSCIYIFLDPVCAMQAYRGRRGIAPLILKLSAKWSTFKFTFLPFRPGRTNPVPFNRRLPGLQIQTRHFVEYTHLLLLPGCEPGRSTAPGYTHNIGCRVLAMCLAAVWL